MLKKLSLNVWVLTLSLLITSFMITENVEAAPTWEQKADKVVTEAKKHINKKYASGGEGPDQFDCSGFTKYVFKTAIQYQLPRTSKDQANKGTTVSKNNIRKGDLLFFNTNGKDISHVAIYIGNNKMIHAVNSRVDIEITDLNNSYWKARFVKAKRIIQ